MKVNKEMKNIGEISRKEFENSKKQFCTDIDGFWLFTNFKVALGNPTGKGRHKLESCTIRYSGKLYFNGLDDGIRIKYKVERVQDSNLRRPLPVGYPNFTWKLGYDI